MPVATVNSVSSSTDVKNVILVVDSTIMQEPLSRPQKNIEFDMADIHTEVHINMSYKKRTPV